jgi:aldehyde:ferredoxin oxidoreductase
MPDWNRKMDYPPMAWFDPANADTDGPIAGKVLDLEKYDGLLDHYYDLRGWDKRGMPTRKTAAALGLEDEARQAEAFGKLED